MNTPRIDMLPTRAQNRGQNHGQNHEQNQPQCETQNEVPVPAQHYADARKIQPANPVMNAAVRPDGSPLDNDRVEIGPTSLAFDEWATAGLIPPDLSAMREWRLQRLVGEINARDYAGVLLFDPLNIRYASDTTNMQLWATHNPFRACLVMADGYMIIWDYKCSDLLTAYNPLVRETRGGASFFYFNAGDGASAAAERFSAEIDSLLQSHCGSNKRLAVDKIMLHGLRALESKGIEVHDGEEIMEKTRAIKGPDEILAMRCSVHACEQAMHEMQRQAAPGMTENDVWSILHAENIKRGGEWIETRLMSSGTRTNPWFQECGPRVIQNNELLAFDTDLVGCYGICCDISRTWFLGDGTPTAEQKTLYQEAHAQIFDNMAQLAPGKSIQQLVDDMRPLPDEYAERRYGCAMHGVGLCDEWPLIKYRNDFEAGEFDATLAPGMVICVEAYIGAVGGKEGVKLEDQVLITEEGYECLSVYPYEECLLT